MGWSVLRVINDDIISPGRGFGLHPHRDMEIVTYVLEGALRHEDSMGNGSVIRAGDVQYMSAGTGVRHSEFNASATDPVHLLQIWILPARQGLAPQYDQKTIPIEQKRGRWRTIATPDGQDDSLAIGQDATLLATVLDGDLPLDYQPRADRQLYVQLARGTVSLNGNRLSAGDGAFIEHEPRLTFSDGRDAELLLFDLP
ncbi:quercetin 2,3-dioxygenase [mine drainage metagenome]|uniref:Quercetin 2,3-dioxygenase n=1 Tax=mine drainage metagenome TaxID=410659 RepID=A0A1J5RBZ3_9ZZZZ